MQHLSVRGVRGAVKCKYYEYHKSQGKDNDNSLLGMLNVLLSSDIKAEENLSDGVERKGIEKGIKIGIEEICACIGCDAEFVNKIETELYACTQ